MNLIPLISHHLFVAAAGNEGRSQERPRRRPAAPDSRGQARRIPLEVVDDSRPVPQGAKYSSGDAASQPPA